MWLGRKLHDLEEKLGPARIGCVGYGKSEVSPPTDADGAPTPTPVRRNRVRTGRIKKHENQAGPHAAGTVAVGGCEQVFLRWGSLLAS